MTLDPKDAIADEAVDLLLAQFKEKPRVEALIRAFASPIQELEDAQQQLLRERWIDSAVGAQLDQLGEIVGEPRLGLSDPEYRVLIRVRIRINRSWGTPEDLLDVMLLLAPETAARIAERFPAELALIATGPLPLRRSRVVGLLHETRLAGVRLILEHIREPVARTLRFGRAADAPQHDPLTGLGRASDYTLGGGLAGAVELARRTTVAPVGPTIASDPTITGTPEVDATLTAVLGSVSGTPPITESVQWQREDGASWANIPGAEAVGYGPTGADEGLLLRVLHNAENDWGTTTRSSDPVGPIVGAVAPTNNVPPVLGGAVSIGASPTVTPGTWSGTEPITYTYTLRRDGTPITGLVDVSEATIEAYVYVAADIGPDIDLVEEADNAAGSDTATSNALAYYPAQEFHDVFDPADAVLVSGDVDQLPSATATGNSLDAASAAVRPLYIASDAGFNGQPVIQADGASEYLVDSAYSFGGAPAAIAIMDVQRIDTFVNGEPLSQYSGGGRSIRLRMLTGPIAQLSGSGTGITNTSGTVVHAVGATRLVGFDWVPGGAQRVFHNASVDASGSNTAATADGGVMEWAAQGGAFTSAISLGLRVMHNATLTTTQRDNLYAYCQWRFGIS